MDRRFLQNDHPEAAAELEADRVSVQTAPTPFSGTTASPGRTPAPESSLTRRRFLLGAAAASAGMALYAGEFARHELQTTHVNVPIRNLPPAFNGFRIAQISDLHLEEFTEQFFLQHVVHHVNSLSPDMVLITGDYISDGPRGLAFSLRSAVACAEILHNLSCPLRFGCLGNHDVIVGGRAVAERIRTSGINILVNQHVPIERQGQHFWLGGIDDPYQGAPRLDLTLPPQPDAPMILMAHEPDFADKLQATPTSRPVDLMLSGHSHGGQVRLPFLKPLTLPPGAKRYYEGTYQVGPTRLYVNRGIGTVGVPFRLNCPPEVSLLTLQAV